MGLTDDFRLKNMKREIYLQLVNFTIAIEVKGFFIVDNKFLASVSPSTITIQSISQYNVFLIYLTVDGIHVLHLCHYIHSI